MSAWLTTRNSVLSTFNAVNINYSTLQGTASNTITTRQMNYSTLMGSTISTNTIGGNAMTTGTLVTTGNVGIGTATVNAPLQFANTQANRKIVLYDEANNDHQYVGFGLNSGTLRYQVDGVNGRHIFYAAASTTTSNELMRILGNGNVGINYNVSSPNYKLVIEQGLGNNSNGLFISNTNYGSMQGFGLSMVNNGSSNFYSYASIQGYTSGVAADVPLCLQPTSGNVGIGITNPSSLLHVNGTIKGSLLTINGIYATDDFPANWAPTNVTPAYVNFIFARGWPGRFADGIVFNTYLDSTGGNPNMLLLNKNGIGMRIYQQTFGSASSFYSGSYADVVLQNSSGNVGIGTNSPFGILQIACTSSTNQATAPDGGTGHGLVFTSPKVSSGTIYAMVMGVDFTTGYGYINGAGNTTIQPILLQSRGGNVGIGTTNPSSLLHVNGNIKVNNDINCKSITIGETPGDPQAFITARTIPSGQGAMSERNELILFMSNDPDNTSGPDTITLRAPYIRLQTYTDANVADINNNNGSNDRLIINSSGNVGIGITNPGFPFTVYGGEGLTYTAGGNNPYIMSPTLSIQNTSAYGAVCAWFQRDVIVGGAMGTFSDIRIKNNIKPAINLLDKINQITIVSHEFIDPFKTPSETSIAVIAQDIINVIPDAVMFNKEVIPNIMQVPISCILLDDIVVITCSNSMDINVNDTVQLILASSNKDCIVSYISDDRKIIYVPKWDNINLLNDQIFIYGKYVNDFHIVDKPKLGLLALGGVKELHQIIKEQQSQINQLLAWAKTQGFQ